MELQKFQENMEKSEKSREVTRRITLKISVVFLVFYFVNLLHIKTIFGPIIVLPTFLY